MAIHTILTTLTVFFATAAIWQITTFGNHRTFNVDSNYTLIYTVKVADINLFNDSDKVLIEHKSDGSIFAFDNVNSRGDQVIETQGWTEIQDQGRAKMLPPSSCSTLLIAYIPINNKSELDKIYCD